MGRKVERQPQPVSAKEFLSDENGLPEKMELVRGQIGPFTDQGIVTLIANWGADRVIAATGPDIWREALVAGDKK